MLECLILFKKLTKFFLLIYKINKILIKMIKPIEVFILFCGVGFICSIIALFSGGFKNISTELIFDHNVFYKENNGWGIKHHISKFTFMFEFGAIPYFYVKTFQPKHIYTKLMIICSIIVSISLCTLLFLIGEIIEESIRLIINSLFNSKWFNGYSSETVSDVILSDGVQSILTGIESLGFIILLGLTPPSFLLVKAMKGYKGYKIIIFRLLLLLIFIISGFLGTFDRNYKDKVIKVGYYAEFFLRLGILGILQKTIKSIDYNVSYYIIYNYYFLISIPLILNVRYWDLFVSNITTILLLLLLFLLKKKIEK